MLFTRVLTTLGFLAVAQACTPGHYSCGNQHGAPGPDGSIQVCNSFGSWQLSVYCGGKNCCYEAMEGDAGCICKIANSSTTLVTATLSA
ncbi:hypothetical protein F5Y18DRAFT_427746 [Xylariaceae sp. FL1019]|nr:hypothetical protein F5Y18DRAFT_427746 [Xylariaceae sp. FL1019]